MSNRLISKLSEEAIMTSPFENWQDENRCLAIAYVNEHFNVCPTGELGQLIAEQAMDDQRMRYIPEPEPSTADEAFAIEATARGMAEVNAFYGFDYEDNPVKRFVTADGEEVFMLHQAPASEVITRTHEGVTRNFWRPKVSKNYDAFRKGLEYAIGASRRGNGEQFRKLK